MIADASPAFGALIARGWDTVKETFNLSVPDNVASSLELARREAVDRWDMSEGLSVLFGGEDMKIRPGGTAGGGKWVMDNDDFTIIIRSPKMEWCVSVEYRAAGLWEYGYHALKARALKAILNELAPRCEPHERDDPRNWQRLSIVHVAFDYYSPEFSACMNHQLWDCILAPSGVKKNATGVVVDMWGAGNRLETLTIGKKNNLQVQVYDKGREITEVSGKMWMLKVWEQAGYYPPEEKAFKNVWRLEIRFGSEFIKNRGILTIDEFIQHQKELLGEALLTRRLVTPTEDKNKARWPLHPLWALAYEEIGKPIHMVPLGRQTTLSGAARYEAIRKSVQGSIMAATMLHVGDYNYEEGKLLSQNWGATMPNRAEVLDKVEKLHERYKHVHDAR